jgi:hypothetical protein
MQLTCSGECKGLVGEQIQLQGLGLGEQQRSDHFRVKPAQTGGRIGVVNKVLRPLEDNAHFL